MSNASSTTSIGNPTVAAPQNMTRYTGSVTSVDDGFASTPISLPAGMTWYYGTVGGNTNTAFTQFYMGTNGYITFSQGSSSILSSPSPGYIMANPGDNWVQSGLQNATPTTTVQDFYTRGGSATYVISGSNDPNGTHYWMDIVCYCGTYGSSTTSRDWHIRLGKYGVLQYVMTRARGNAAGQPGLYGTNGVAYGATASNNNQVWVSSTNGASWYNYGAGFLSMLGPPMTYPPINGVSLSAVVDNLAFRCPTASTTNGYEAPVGYGYHNQYGDGRAIGGTGSAGDYGGSRYFYGGSYLSMGSWYLTILNFVVGNFGAGDLRYTFMTNTSSGYQAADINGDGSINLSDGIAIQNIQVGNAGYTATTDTPVIRMRNLFSLARSSTYYESLSGTYYLVGNISLNYLRPGYQVYATNTYQIANYDNSDGTGIQSRRMYLYSSYVHQDLPESGEAALNDNAEIAIGHHISAAQSVLQIGTGPRGANP